MRVPWVSLGITATMVVALGGMALVSAVGAGSNAPAWALGEQPNFSGTIGGWADGDAIAPGPANIYAMAGDGGGGEESDVGYGTIDAGGRFTFGLQRGAAAAGGGRPAAEAFCDEFDLVSLSMSHPEQLLVGVNELEVTELYEEGKHARPRGGILIRVAPPSPGSLLEQFNFVYASTDGTLRGTCSTEGLSV